MRRHERVSRRFPFTPAGVRWNRLAPLWMALTSGMLLALAFPRWDLSPLAWIALVPLFHAAAGRPSRQAFLLGFLGGLPCYMISMAWLTETMINFGGMNLPLSYILVLLLASYLSLYIGASLGLATWFKEHRGWSITFTAPFLWVSLEFIRAKALTGFPWNLLAYTQYRATPLIQICDTTGPYGLSFLIVMVNAAVYEALTGPARRRWRPPVVAFLAVAAVATYGFAALHSHQPGGTSIPAVYVQANIPQDQKWDPDYRLDIIQRYLDLTSQAMAAAPGRPPRLIIWPEAATPYYFRFGDHHLLDDGRTYNQAVYDLIREGPAWLVLGTPDVDPQSDANYNGAFLLSPEGRIEGHYWKQHLVPFGEYVPLRKVLFFVEKMAEVGGDTDEGDAATVFNIPGVPPFSVYICYETIFPDLLRRFVKNGAAFLVNLTNDAWFGGSSGPYQHFAMTVFRAVENRVPVVRCANTGISGSFDACGRILSCSPLLTTAIGPVEIGAPGRPTFYTRHGDMFAVCCLSVCLVMTAITAWRRQRFMWRKK
ncbi:apolipoprotein N-acyltransferase [bacterium]|nr:apolipoprotein N-acyltransferase [candidate division CSSED10-310 bacterium]